MKNFLSNEKDRKENQKIIDIVDKKTFQPGLRRGKEKPRLGERGGTCLRRDLVDEGLGQNKIPRSSLEVKLLMVNYHAGSLALSILERQISDYLPASGSRIALTRISLCYLFFVTSLGELLSMSYWLSLFSLCGELDCWLGHGQSRVQRCWYYCWLLRMIFVEGADHLPRVHDCQRRFLGVFLFWVTLLYNQIV